MKSDFKIGVLYVKHEQQSEDEIFSNTSHSSAFESFLHLLGDRVSLQGFEGYSGGLDTSNSLNGAQSIYTEYRNNRIMFHVPTLMPNTGEDNKYVSYAIYEAWQLSLSEHRTSQAYTTTLRLSYKLTPGSTAYR